METAPSQDTGTSHPHLASLTTSRAERLAQLEEVSGNVDAPYDPSREQNAQGVVEPETKTLATSYAFWFPPLGLFGAHQYYLRNYFIAVFCSLTLGGVGVVWLVDLFRMKILVQRENDRIRTGLHVCYLDDAYLLHIPWGCIGLHQYYMGNIKTAVTYTCTLSFCGIMWVFDMFAMPAWVEECNEDCGDETSVANIEGLAIHTSLSPEPTPDHGPPPQYTMDDSLPPPSYYSVMQNAEQYLRPPPMPLSAEEAMQTEEYLNLTFPQRGETDDSGQSVFDII